MFEHTTEAEARKQILDLVADYCDTFHKQKKNTKKGTAFRMRPEFMITAKWSIW